MSFLMAREFVNFNNKILLDVGESALTEREVFIFSSLIRVFARQIIAATLSNDEIDNILSDMVEDNE